MIILYNFINYYSLNFIFSHSIILFIKIKREDRIRTYISQLRAHTSQLDDFSLLLKDTLQLHYKVCGHSSTLHVVLRFNSVTRIQHTYYLSWRVFLTYFTSGISDILRYLKFVLLQCLFHTLFILYLLLISSLTFLILPYQIL